MSKAECRISAIEDYDARLHDDHPAWMLPNYPSDRMSGVSISEAEGMG